MKNKKILFKKYYVYVGDDLVSVGPEIETAKKVAANLCKYGHKDVRIIEKNIY